MLLSLGFASAGARAETRSGLMLRPMPKGKNTELGLEVRHYLDSKTDAGFDGTMFLLDAGGRIRLKPELERRSPLLGFDVTRIEVGPNDPLLPGSLTDASVAVGFGFPAGDWIVNLTLGVGFAGDEPFDGRGAYGLGSVTTTKFIDKGNFLQFGVDFDGNRPIFPDVPLPVVVWTRVWNKTLRTSIGIPFLGITWDPSDTWTIEFRGIPGIFQSGRVIYHLGEDIDVFVRYGGTNFRFLVDGFPNDNRRLFYTEERVEFGVTATVNRTCVITFTAGWTFDRKYETGWDVRDTTRITGLDDAAFLGLTVAITF